MNSKSGKGCWYFITYYECPACGNGPENRERREGQKPKEWNKRHQIIQVYDHCLGV